MSDGECTMAEACWASLVLALLEDHLPLLFSLPSLQGQDSTDGFLGFTFTWAQDTSAPARADVLEEGGKHLQNT